MPWRPIEADMQARQTKERELDQAGVERLGAMLRSPDCQIEIAAAIVKNAWIIVPCSLMVVITNVNGRRVTGVFSLKSGG